jgi:hypothetical protein
VISDKTQAARDGNQELLTFVPEISVIAAKLAFPDHEMSKGSKLFNLWHSVGELSGEAKIASTDARTTCGRVRLPTFLPVPHCLRVRS